MNRSVFFPDVNRPGIPETVLIESRGPRRVLALAMIRCFGLRRRSVPDDMEEASSLSRSIQSVSDNGFGQNTPTNTPTVSETNRGVDIGIFCYTECDSCFMGVPAVLVDACRI